MGQADYYKHGDWNAICDRCGFKYKASDLRKEYTGLRVCKDCFDPRHPQERLRVRPDDPSVPWTRTEPDVVELSNLGPELVPDPFFNGDGTWVTTHTVDGGLFVTGADDAEVGNLGLVEATYRVQLDVIDFEMGRVRPDLAGVLGDITIFSDATDGKISISQDIEVTGDGGLLLTLLPAGGSPNMVITKASVRRKY